MRLKLYDSISNQSSYTLKELSQFKLTTAEVDSLAKNVEEEHQIPGFYLSQLYQENYFLGLFDRVLSHPAIRRYRLEDIISTSITSSDDEKLYNITIPENTGGSYHSRLSWIHYRANDGKNYNFAPAESSDSGDSFNKDGFFGIQTMQTKDGVKYLLDGQVVGCNTCIGYYIQLVHFNKGKPVFDFSYSLGTRNNYDDNGAISYDPDKKIIEVENTPFEADLAQCDCKTDAQRNYSSSYHEEADNALAGTDDDIRRGKSLRCLFRFNGHTFVLDKKRSRLPIVRDEE